MDVFWGDRIWSRMCTGVAVTLTQWKIYSLECMMRCSMHVKQSRLKVRSDLQPSVPDFFIYLNSKVLIMLLSILTQNKSRDSASVVDKSTLLSLFGGNDCWQRSFGTICDRCSMDRDCDKHCNGDVAIKYSGCCGVCSEVCNYFLTKKALGLEVWGIQIHGEEHYNVHKARKHVMIMLMVQGWLSSFLQYLFLESCCVI